MKTKFILMLLFLANKSLTIAQATDGLPATGNVFTATKYLGWGNTSGNLDFRTNNVNRMSLMDNTGFFAIGLNFNTPAALLHLNGNGYNTGELFRTSGPAINNYWKMFTGAGNGVERFRLYTQANNNVFFETTTQNAIYGIRTGNIGTQGLRFMINGQASTNPTAGRIASNFS